MARIITKKKVTLSISFILFNQLKAIGKKSNKNISQLVEAALKRYYSDPLKAAVDERQKHIDRIHELNPYIDRLEKSLTEKKFEESKE